MRRAIKSRQSQDWLPGVAGDPTSTGSRFWGPRLRKGARTGPLFHFRDGWLEVPASGLLIILCDRVAVDIVRDRIAIDILRDRIAMDHFRVDGNVPRRLSLQCVSSHLGWWCRLRRKREERPVGVPTARGVG